LLEVATILVLIAHLVCVNVAAGGPIVCVWLEWKQGALARRAACYLGQLSLLALVAGGLLGVVLGGMKWTPEYQSLWSGPLSNKLHWAVGEFAFSMLLAIAYWLWARGGAKVSGAAESVAARLGRGTLAVLNGTNLLYHFPTLFIVANKLHAAGQISGEAIRGAAFRDLAGAGDTPALAMHVGLASVAVAAVTLLGLALWLMRQSAELEDSRTLASWGGRWALAASLAQIPVGLWTLLKLPAGAQSRLLGGDPLGTGLLFAAMLAALWLLRELAAVSMGETTQPVLVRAMAAMLVVVGLMTAMQQVL
jgi:hypothetical protein